jgi:uncharacterized protein YecE (DUF72 family)
VFAGIPELRIGTSSWSERDWVGPFYPAGMRPERFIEHYSTRYDTVEIDATFYRAPSPRQVRAWRERTPEGFLFSAKTPRSITHEKMLEGAEAEMRDFVETLSGLESRLGPILLQFPYFNRQAFPGPGPFFDRLDRFLGSLPTGPRYVVEVRNRSWVGKQLQEICVARRVALAWVEQAWMPGARDWPRITGGPSTDFAYVRWLGDHKAIEQVTQRWDRPVLDRSAVIEDWAAVICELIPRVHTVFGYFNNHFAGHAPASVDLFRERIESVASRAPRE